MVCFYHYSEDGNVPIKWREVKKKKKIQIPESGS